jgi:nitrogen regulatory protein PII
MKKIEAVVDLFKLDEIKRSLASENVQRLTIFEMKGAGRQQGKVKQYRGVEYIEDLSQAKIEAIVDDDEAQRLADVILETLRTGDLCDGEVAILPIEKSTRVRVGQRNGSISNWRDNESPAYLMKRKIRLISRLKTLREHFMT